MALRDKLGFMVFADATGLPNAAATPSWAALVAPGGGAFVPQPARVNLGGGKFGVDMEYPSGGLAFVLDAGAGNHFGASGSRYMSGGFFDDRMPFGVAHLVNEATGALWAGAAPAFHVTEGWDDFAGVLQPAPAIVTAAVGLYTFIPTTTDLAEGRVWRLDSPAGASPATWFGSFFKGAGLTGSQHPAHDLATALVFGGVIDLLDPPGGSVVVGYGAGVKNVVRGPARDADELVGNRLINVLPTGGPPPMPYMGSPPNENVYSARVQVVVRSRAEDYEGCEALARACRAKLHLVEIAGYVSTMAQESEPLYLGVDDRGLHRFSLNFVMRYKA